ncbi:MAG: cellulase family glycosylhydrolase, partial [Clostridium sp.]|nr:cellulase family glycosylhydrolase [Clostridium sp.]
GCDYIPAYAINQLEMWQEETFDIQEIDKELGWAEELGFNCMRVFLHHVLWETDREGFKDRIDRYLEVSSGHGISTMLVFLDDCWNESCAPGMQPLPERGVHNSGWAKDPGILYFGPCGSGCMYAEDTTAIVSVLENYVKDIMTEFRDDDRIFAWDLYNEPGGGQDPDRYYERSFPLLKSIFGWAREVNPSQPVTAGVWHPRLKDMNAWQIANSDIITYHTYEPLEQHRQMLDTLKAYGRPMVCTEYMARTQGSTFESIMPMLKEENVGAISWGFVAGKTNTIFAWSTPLDADEPELWFHDILRGDGTPYCEEEAVFIKSLAR